MFTLIKGHLTSGVSHVRVYSVKHTKQQWSLQTEIVTLLGERCPVRKLQNLRETCSARVHRRDETLSVHLEQEPHLRQCLKKGGI